MLTSRNELSFHPAALPEAVSRKKKHPCPRYTGTVLTLNLRRRSRQRSVWKTISRLALRSCLIVAFSGLAVLGSLPVGASIATSSFTNCHSSPGISGCNVPGAQPASRVGWSTLSRTTTYQTFFVAPTGNDANPGTRSRPFRTLLHAQRMVRDFDRNMQADIRVYLAGGTYRLSKPLLFGLRDSGTNGHKVVWSALPGERPVISGAEQIRGWALADKSRNIWTASVPRTVQSRQMYVDGMRASMAAGLPPVALKKTPTGYQASSSAMASWRNISDVDFVYPSQLGLMAEPICPVASIKGRVITMAEPCWSNTTRRPYGLVAGDDVKVPGYVENAYELLDRPGEFYLDRKLHSLYYIPRKGENLTTADVEVPVLQTLMSGAGTPTAPIHDIEFDNLEFSYATWLRPDTPTGFSEVQSNFTLTGNGAYRTEGLCHTATHGTCPFGAWAKEPGNIQFTYDQHLSFVDDTFVHLGAAGLNLDNGSQNITVAASVFTDISGNGIEIGDVNMPEAKGASQTTGVQVLDSHVYGLPVEYHGGVGVFVGYAADTLIAHNQIDHTSYVAISLGWGGWLDKMHQPPVPNFSNDNVVSDNLIFDCMLTLKDGGGIYTQGISGSSMPTGEKIVGNVLHDQLDWGYAMHSDDGATYVTYRGNLLYNNSYDFGSFHIDYRGPQPRHGQRPYDAHALLNNFWEQGYPNVSQPGRAVEAHGNKIVGGPADVPASVLTNAGIETRFRYLLAYRTSKESLPGSPFGIKVLYAFHGKAWVSWQPPVVEGIPPINSYTVTACVGGVQAPCPAAGSLQATIPASRFLSVGYVVVPGLNDREQYTFEVTANSLRGSGSPSIRSAPVRSTGYLNLSSRPTKISFSTGDHILSMIWYGPWTSWGNPVLAYIVKSSTGRQWTVTGLRELINGNLGGRLIRVFEGLATGKTYWFSIAAVTPAGIGPGQRSRSITLR